MALVRRILGDAQAKLRKMVDEQVSVGSRVEAEPEPEPADPLITPASAALSIDNDRTPRLLIGTLDKRNSSLNGDGTSTLNRTRLPIRNGKDNPFIDDDNKENQANGKLESPVKWSTQNGSDSGTYAEIGTGANSNTSERNVLDPADSSEEEVPLPDATSPGRSSDGPEPRADITATLDGGAASPGGRSDRSRADEIPASPGMLSAAQLARRLRVENERLQAELTRVRRLLVAAAERGEAGNALIERAKGDGAQESAPVDPQQLEKELLLAREAVNSLKADKKRLKAERFDLLNQMKQLYATLEDKEKELRDFIRNYELMRSRGGASSALGAERAERERERAALLRHARDEAERSLQLAAALSARDTQLRYAREQLFEVRRQLQATGCLSEGESVASLGLGPPMMLGPAGLVGDRGSCSADSGVRGSCLSTLSPDVTGSSDGGATSVCGGNLSDSTAEGAPATVDSYDTDAISLVSSAHHIYQLSTPRDCSPTLSPHNSASPFTRSIDAGSLSRSVEQLSSPGECESALLGGLRSRAGGKGGRGRGSAWGSISRVFARSRHRTKSGSATASGHESEPVYAGTGSQRAWSPLGSEAALREAASLPLARWRAPAIIAWLELALGMPQYAAAVADNVKSGKVLLELTDADLEVGLGISQPMHRKKLRLAIEERRRPDLVRNPAIGQLTHAWVAAEWLSDLGLAQYAESFLANLVDARMLDTISKKELEKYLGVTRKFHQASIVHGIHLLRIMKYDRQALAVRRHQCENVDADPLVWTNQRFMRWAHNIDLGEFAENLKDSGVHGGLVVLEPSFTGETMATALGIPPSKSIIRRHLVAEFDALIIPARNMFGHQIRMLGRPFSRSVATGLPGIDLSGDSRRHSLRGSITRALGVLKPKHDRTSPSSSSESSSVLSLTTQPYQMSYSPPIGMRTLSQLSMTYAPPPTLQEYEPIYTPLSLYSQSSVSTRDSLQRLNDIKENVSITHRYGQKADHAHRVSSPLPAKSVDESIVKQKRHRRVKSIGDINACSKTSV
ncbi:kazrin isoform X2 [Pectinophora gossypiella]|uniref:kazrin isoform X2 n=1 Tax=Pectinophora gossypiella TaxID=13191 RepID=UPI00214E1E0F|nr:kazrin isoform X2 [Pectinophora gossypiella]